jgi:nitrogen fixation/metabolism regulation signal transduction histidine kinase
VIGLDRWVVNLPNSASSPRGRSQQAIGQDLAEVAPEAGLLDEVGAARGWRSPGTAGHREQHPLLVRIAAEHNGRNISVTFDDITELLAQRKAAPISPAASP